MPSIRSISRALQHVLTPVANEAARESRCVQRQRKFSGATLVQTLVLGWLNNPDASLHELTQLAATRGVAISPQGLAQRFTPALASCLEVVLAAAVETSMAADPVAIPLLQRFSRVQVLDSTTLSLPSALAERWPGCGGRAGGGQAALKLQVGLDLRNGELSGPRLQPGRAHDRRSPLQPALPPGSLRLADLGYFSLDTLHTLSSQDVGWISRLQANTGVFTPDGTRRDLATWLARRPGAVVDQAITLGVRRRLPARLLALRVPDTVASERRRLLHWRARRKQHPASPERLALAGWTILVTNLPLSRLTPHEAAVLYRARWQIELLFKLWKSQGRLTSSRSTDPQRVLCECYAKLIGLLIQHWLLLGCWAEPQRSLTKAAQTIRKQAFQVACVLDHRALLARVITSIQTCLTHQCRSERRRRSPSTAQTLLDPLVGGLT